MATTESQLREWGKVLHDHNASLYERFEVLEKLETAKEPLAIELIAGCFHDPSHLLKHELAYVLGQKEDTRAIPDLVRQLEDEHQACIARHEAAEALGAIGSPDVIPILERFSKHESKEIRETCELALARIQWLLHGDKENILRGHDMTSVDPAPPLHDMSAAKLEALLVNPSQTLFQRYRAMFTLRNKIANGKNDEEKAESVRALAAGLKCPDSALLRHEVAFVLGQVPHVSAVPFLRTALENTHEHEIVRHESAEALGKVGTEECQQVLRTFLSDPNPLIVESCVLALHIKDYTNNPKQFQL